MFIHMMQEQHVETMCEVFSEFGLPENIHAVIEVEIFYPTNSHNSLIL